MMMLSEAELKVFKNILIQGGYVLDFNDVEFKQFILRCTGIDVHSKSYLNKVNDEMGGTSKGKTLTYFLYNESESTVLNLLSELIDYVGVLNYEDYEINLDQLNMAKNILNKHKTDLIKDKSGLELPKLSSDELKVFISYSSKDFEKAEKVYKMFDEGDIDCFLAQMDLKGGVNWNPVILKKLMHSNVFILMLSENFFNSAWCNQEASIAFLQYEFNNALLIPIYIDGTRPYGIFYDVQGIYLEDFDSLEEFARLVDDSSISFENAIELINAKKFDEVNIIIDELRNSNSFQESNTLFNRLKSKNITSKHVDEIIEIALWNFQVLYSAKAHLFFSKYVRKFEKELDSENVNAIKEFL